MKLEVGKKYRRGNTIVEVKFFDKTGHAWGLSTEGCAQCISSSKHEWQEVTDTPEPGQGWRLLHPDEDVKIDDEWFCDEATGWVVTLQAGTRQGVGLFYRRRSAPQYVPYTWEDAPMLRGRWYRIKNGGTEAMVIRFSVDGDVFCMNGLPAQFFLNECEWLDGTPCGKKSE
jgi:hypothetical protein